MTSAPPTAQHRTDVWIPSGGELLAAWLYPPSTPNAPVVVMAHGVGGVKEMRLDAYADRFAAAGYAVVVFDYRHFGASGGHPRQLLDIGTQLDDWRNVLAWVRAHDEADPRRIVLWGTSFGGGHVLRIAAEAHGPEDIDAEDHADVAAVIAAVIAQCPFTDGPASLRAENLRSVAKVAGLAVLDLLASVVGRGPVMVSSAGPSGSAALMTGPDCPSGYLALTDSAPTFRNQVAARFGLAIAGYRPGRATGRIAAPVFFALCESDSVAPAAAARRDAERAPHGEVRRYPFGHFEVYLGQPLEQVVADSLDFLDRHVPVAPAAAPTPDVS